MMSGVPGTMNRWSKVVGHSMLGARRNLDTEQTDGIGCRGHRVLVG